MSQQPKNALVTGGAIRLGREIALSLASLGWGVAIHYNGSADEAQRTVSEIAATGGRAIAIRADLAREAEVAALIGRVGAQFGTLGLLVNNAAVFESDEWNTATRDSWDLHMEINLRAPFVLSQDFARQLAEGATGAIINILDQRVFKPTPKFMTYSLSKAGLHWLTTTMAQALAPQVRVNAIAPGPSFIGKRQDVETFERQRAATPLGHGASASDLLGAIAYLVGAPTVTGQTITVDGGQHIAWQTPDFLVQE